MKSIASIIFITVAAIIASVECDSKTLECTPIPDRMRGFTFCHFNNQSTTDQDVSKVKVLKSMFQGRYIESNQVTAIFIGFSDFNNIPKSVFENFGDVSRLKIMYSTIRAINSDDFETASHLRVLEIGESKIGNISSKAFGSLKNLEEITIENSEIENFSADAFDGLEKLRIVNLKGNTYKNSQPNFETIPLSKN